jgi:hypothetical protein
MSEKVKEIIIKVFGITGLIFLSILTILEARFVILNYNSPDMDTDFENYDIENIYSASTCNKEIEINNTHCIKIDSKKDWKQKYFMGLEEVFDFKNGFFKR